MIKIECNGIVGIAAQPRMSYRTIGELVGALNGDSRGVAFVDIAFSQSVQKLIKCVGKVKPLRMYIDHHAPYDPSLSFPSSRFNFTLLRKRIATPSCCELVIINDWKRGRVGTVFFHDDLDGFYSFIRGCGLEYPGMISDIRKIDGGVGNVAISKPGIAIVNSLNFSYPKFDAPRGTYANTRKEFYNKFIKWLISGRDPVLLDQLFSEAIELKSSADDRSSYVAKKCTRLISSKRDVVECDLRHHTIAGNNINFHSLKKEIGAKYKKAKIVGIISRTPASSKVVILTLRKGIDLRKIAPRGCGVHVSNRASIELGKWPAFIWSWEKYIAK